MLGIFHRKAAPAVAAAGAALIVTAAPALAAGGWAIVAAPPAGQNATERVSRGGPRAGQ